MAHDERIHVWHSCHQCGAQPIVGTRHECQTCPAGPDRDLCDRCYARWRAGAVRHPMPGSYVADVGASHVFEPHEGRSAAEATAWMAIEAPGAPDPQVPDRFVVRPEFRCGLESFFGSHAFVVELDHPGGPAVLLTALHVMDELIRGNGIDCTTTNPSYTGTELPAVVTGVELYDVFADRWMLAHCGTAGKMLVLPQARLGDEEPRSQRDVAAFEIGDPGSLTPARLATEPPAAGDPIWLAVPSAGGRRVQRAAVVERAERTLVFRFAEPSSGPRYSSGAPLLDRQGRVVGINVGGGALGGRRLGHGAHCASIRRHLRTSTGDHA